MEIIWMTIHAYLYEDLFPDKNVSRQSFSGFLVGFVNYFNSAEIVIYTVEVSP